MHDGRLHCVRGRVAAAAFFARALHARVTAGRSTGCAIARARHVITPRSPCRSRSLSCARLPSPERAAEYYSDSLLALMRVVMPLPPNPPAAAREAGRAMFREARDNGRYHASGGIALLTGTDSAIAPSPLGFTARRTRASGSRRLTPLAALRSATVEAARYLSAADSLGSVALEAGGLCGTRWRPARRHWEHTAHPHGCR